MKREQRIQAFVSEIWSWYARHKRTLPWRDLKIQDDTQRAYMILVSEIMLQQTQVSRVQIVFKRFLESFPTLQDLEQASNKEVILAWRGMGYNSRVLRLRDAAQIVCEQFHGVFPREMDELLSIKGIGNYTAAAVRNFAFNLPTPCIDTNIRRIFHRTFIGPENADGTWKADDKELLKLAEEILQEVFISHHSSFISRAAAAAEWHAALMDFGSLVQTKRNPKWEICPLTAKHIMMTTPKTFALLVQTPRGGVSGKAPSHGATGKTPSHGVSTQRAKKRAEPGRMVAGKHVPNRIFRGRVVETLRDHQTGLQLDQIGSQITVDWDPNEHREWLQGILDKLVRDMLIKARGKKFALMD